MIPSGARKATGLMPKLVCFATQLGTNVNAQNLKRPPSSPLRGENSQTSETRQLSWTHGIVMFIGILWGSLQAHRTVPLHYAWSTGFTDPFIVIDLPT